MMRWLVLDEVVEIRKGRSAHTRSRIPDTEFHSEPLLLEMMAQTGGLLLGAESDFRDDVIFGKIESADFAEDLKPGEPVEIRAASDQLRPEGSWVEAFIEGRSGRIASARLMLMHPGPLVPGKARSTTFHEDFMSHFKIREKIR